MSNIPQHSNCLNSGFFQWSPCFYRKWYDVFFSMESNKQLCNLKKEKERNALHLLNLSNPHDRLTFLYRNTNDSYSHKLSVFKLFLLEEPGYWIYGGGLRSRSVWEEEIAYIQPLKIIFRLLIEKFPFKGT